MHGHAKFWLELTSGIRIHAASYGTLDPSGGGGCTVEINLKLRFDDEWKWWIWDNIHRGCNKDSIFKILLENGYSYDLIRRELQHELEGPERETNLETDADLQDTHSTYHPVSIPGAVRFPSPRVELYTLDNFMSPTECDKMIRTMEGHLRPSTITNDSEPDKYYRTSRTCDLCHLTDPFVDQIDDRICRVLGINGSYSEGIQAQYYREGEEFKPHTDYFEPGSEEYGRFAQKLGQRTWTFLVYLNNVERGGATWFLHLNARFFPKQGQAVIWSNVDSSGDVNPQTMHYGMPIKKGYKAIITKWFRSRGVGSQY